jgi:hypothetical protein
MRFGLGEKAMATLVMAKPASLKSDDASQNGLPLRTWQEAEWLILFSHPRDFESCELESDRWLSVIQRSFAGSRIKPLELLPAHGTAGQGSWIDQVNGDNRHVHLYEIRSVGSNARDLRLYALREEIAALGPHRFVMILDESLRIRRTYAYSALTEVPSPLEFLGWAAAARAKSAATAWARERRAAY